MSTLRTITAGYTIEFARVLRNRSPNAVFSFLSGNGADPTGRSRLAFARYKGEAERALLAAGFPHVYLFRPAYIYPVQPRKEPNFSYRLIRAVYPVFRLLFPNQVVRADALARAMVDVVLRETQEPQGLILENRGIRAMNSVIRILWLIPTICPTIFGAVGGQPSSLQTGATELIWRLSFNCPIRIP